MASDDTPGDRIKAVLARLAEQGVNPPDDTQSAPLPPIMTDPRSLFDGQGESHKVSLLARLRGIPSSADAPQIPQDGAVDSPGSKDAAE